MTKPNRPIRTYYQVGPGGAMYLIVTLLLLIVARFTQANMLFWAFGLMVGGLVVSLSLSWMMMRGLSVERLLPGHVVANEPMALRYHVVNHKRWLPSFGLVISEDWGTKRQGWRVEGPLVESPRRLGGRPFGWVLHVGPHQAVQAEATCWPLRRGMLHFDRVIVSSSFPFGIVRRVIELAEPDDALVYPRLFRMNRRTLHRLSETPISGKKHLERGGGHEEFFGLRDYRAGDSLKTIDWKRSARTGDLVTREMTQPSPPIIMIVLDLSELPPPSKPTAARRRRWWFGKSSEGLVDPFDENERAVSLTASLVCDAHFNGYQTGLIVLGAECMAFPVHHSLPHRTKMLESLAMLDVYRKPVKSPTLPAQPSVFIRPGRAASGSIPGRQTQLGSAHLEEYTELTDGHGSPVLMSRPGLRSRRQQLREEERWV